jgi:hypothetical protein
MQLLILTRYVHENNIYTCGIGANSDAVHTKDFTITYAASLMTS